MRRLGLGAESRSSHTSGQGELLDEDEWLLSGLALELGMPKITLHSWLKRGWLKARRGQKRSGQWIVWADEEEVERLRRLRALPAGYNVRQMWLR
jgi:hypothetical protein